MSGPFWDDQEIDPDLLDAYGYYTPITYGGYTLPRYIYYMLAGINQVGASVGQQANSFYATSTTPATIGSGAKTLTVQINKGFLPDMYVLAFDASDTTRFMAGLVTGYTQATGVLNFTVSAGDFLGTGSSSNWKVVLSGRRGPEGSVWYTGSGAPNDGVGKDADFYLNATNGDVYRKTGTTWGSVLTNIRGPQGDTGPQGPPGSGTTISVMADGTLITALPRANLNFTGGAVITDVPGSNRVDIVVGGALGFISMSQGVY